MTTVEFDFNLWDDRTDVPLTKAGTQLGYAAINGPIRLKTTDNARRDRRTATTQGLIDGAVELVAGALEWLRSEGLTADEVQAKVKVFKVNNRASTGPAGVAVLKSQSARNISDPRNIAHLINPEKRIR